jgi:hypothetical protein
LISVVILKFEQRFITRHNQCQIGLPILLQRREKHARDSAHLLLQFWRKLERPKPGMEVSLPSRRVKWLHMVDLGMFSSGASRRTE